MGNYIPHIDIAEPLISFTQGLLIFIIVICFILFVWLAIRRSSVFIIIVSSILAVSTVALASPLCLDIFKDIHFNNDNKQALIQAFEQEGYAVQQEQLEDSYVFPSADRQYIDEPVFTTDNNDVISAGTLSYTIYPDGRIEIYNDQKEDKNGETQG